MLSRTALRSSGARDRHDRGVAIRVVRSEDAKLVNAVAEERRGFRATRVGRSRRPGARLGTNAGLDGCGKRPMSSAARVGLMIRSLPDERRIVTIAFPGESAGYRAARDRLLEQEIELRRATEAVAVSRRALPPGGPIPEDYAFHGADADGAPRNVKLSELFEPGKHSLVIYNFMFPRDPADISPGPASGETALLLMEEG